MMSDTVESDIKMVDNAENTEDRGAKKNSFNLFVHIIDRLNLKKINQANTLVIIGFIIYFFVFITLAIVNPKSLKNFNYSAYLQIGFIAVIAYCIFMSYIGNLRNSIKNKKK